ncbi:peptide chain release factor 1 [Limnoraphis robusta Tam1]|uniref:Peptide chain release factor 1 n=1 Tax=Limnoraphis robusta CS-951 TaxID=1637645 RepID=A0A0F5YFL4_9CYAN|nr:hypothetical protein [Limnoraphis robusta]KKD37442.1 peptide chain release factor 1 [Limnoraphis robusta CS-951]MEA5500702.1 peptide chain release factor 1 [Limnoraphis robusta BA-68 BA1]MEA5539803.1 peptide chain release factor 1 [Limnoraphis robusta Tam1]
MNHWMQRLKNFPWRSLLQSATLSNLLIAALEILLFWGVVHSPVVGNVLKMLFSPPLGVLTQVAIAIGMGALTVYWLEIWQQRFLLNSSTLWALVGCLLLGLFIKSLLPLPTFLVDLSSLGLMGILIGVFWKGRPYWR